MEAFMSALVNLIQIYLEIYENQILKISGPDFQILLLGDVLKIILTLEIANTLMLTLMSHKKIEKFHPQ